MKGLDETARAFYRSKLAGRTGQFENEKFNPFSKLALKPPDYSGMV